MISSKKVDTTAVEEQLMTAMSSMLANIYSNKSSDEYKSHGDIRLTSEYSEIEKMVADLTTLKNFPKTEATDLKTLFDTLHRPVFSKMVSEYIIEPNEKNTLFTTVYTVGFRVLVGELARIYSSTEATDKGIVYKPDKVSKKNDMSAFIRSFNSSLEKRINDYIRTSHIEDKKNSDDDTADTITEAFLQEGAMKDAVVSTYKFLYTKSKYIVKEVIWDGIKNIFRNIKELNPVALVNTILTAAYESKVSHFVKVSELYEATKEAYKEYMKLPESQRKEKIESKYRKNIDKYNIKMNNLWAAIEHYDQRAVQEAQNQANRINTSTKVSKPNDDSKTDSSSGDPSGNDDFDF